MSLLEMDKKGYRAKGIPARTRSTSVALVEMELVYRSEGREDALLKDMTALASIPNTAFEPLTPDVTLSAVLLRQAFDLGFFNSHHAATALKLDGSITSFDKAYDGVKGLKRIDPASA